MGVVFALLALALFDVFVIDIARLVAPQGGSPRQGVLREHALERPHNVVRGQLPAVHGAGGEQFAAEVEALLRAARGEGIAIARRTLVVDDLERGASAALAASLGKATPPLPETAA